MSREPPETDHSADLVLELDGVTFFVDPDESYRVRFEIRRVDATQDRPHGLSYSITLHDPSGRRIFGYDNAHGVSATSGPGGRKSRSHDHVHRGDTVRPYKFTDAAALLADFWKNVDKILESKGVKK